MAGETGYYKDQCLLRKVAGGQKHYADVQKLSKRPTDHQTEQLLKPKQDRTLQYIDEFNTVLNSVKKAQLGGTKGMDLTKAKPGRKEEDTLILNKPSEESRETGGFSSTGPDSCEGPEAGVLRGSGGEGNPAQREPEPPHHPQEVCAGSHKYCGCKPIQGQNEQAKELEGRCAVWTWNSTTISTMLAASSQCIVGVIWLVLYNHLSFCGSIRTSKLTWLVIGNRCIFLGCSVHESEPGVICVYTELSYYKLNFYIVCNHKSYPHIFEVKTNVYSNFLKHTSVTQKLL